MEVRKPWIIAWDTKRGLVRATETKVRRERQTQKMWHGARLCGRGGRSNASATRRTSGHVHVSGGGGNDEKKARVYLFNYQRYRINSLIERQMASIVSGWHALYPRNAHSYTHTRFITHGTCYRSHTHVCMCILYVYMWEYSYSRFFFSLM